MNPMLFHHGHGSLIARIVGMYDDVFNTPHCFHNISDKGGVLISHASSSQAESATATLNLVIHLCLFAN